MVNIAAIVWIEERRENDFGGFFKSKVPLSSGCENSKLCIKDSENTVDEHLFMVQCVQFLEQ